MNKTRDTPQDTSGNTTLDQARLLVSNLRALSAVEAPPTLRSAVMKTLGIGDAYFELATPLGLVYVAYNPRGISTVTRAISDAAFEQAFREQMGGPIYPAQEPPATLVHTLESCIRGEARPQLRFDLRGLSEFERAVLLKALEIPRGEVRPYAWIAREIGSPKAVRAVGTALAHNPVPILIPCHRVVRSDGHLGQYSLGGNDAKRAMLTAEGADPDTLEELAREGVRYFGTTTTHAFCYPSCGHGHREADEHRIYFASEKAAILAGYHPCSDCRPA
ncbi:MAG: Methylated-DNA--protein-cysteine methyltransferase [Ktedonobacterales bacterium]|jgi:O-6-methylguanine DNA methyltransferase|nr:MAG: Methylated-DNA--protein-cysteine methyltransferase [Ktedonobacterales bacterium]